MVASHYILLHRRVATLMPVGPQPLWHSTQRTLGLYDTLRPRETLVPCGACPPRGTLGHHKTLFPSGTLGPHSMSTLAHMALHALAALLSLTSLYLLPRGSVEIIIPHREFKV